MTDPLSNNNYSQYITDPSHSGETRTPTDYRYHSASELPITTSTPVSTSTTETTPDSKPAHQNTVARRIKESIQNLLGFGTKKGEPLKNVNIQLSRFTTLSNDKDLESPETHIVKLMNLESEPNTSEYQSRLDSQIPKSRPQAPLKKNQVPENNNELHGKDPNNTTGLQANRMETQTKKYLEVEEQKAHKGMEKISSQIIKLQANINQTTIMNFAKTLTEFSLSAVDVKGQEFVTTFLKQNPSVVQELNNYQSQVGNEKSQVGNEKSQVENEKSQVGKDKQFRDNLNWINFSLKK